MTDITALIMSESEIWQDSQSKIGSYDYAMALKAEGEFHEAASIFMEACDPPSIYKGHYYQLFVIWRIFNKSDLKTGDFSSVIDRVKMMIKLDDQMIDCVMAPIKYPPH